jgi:hypothetical protein
MIAQRQVRMAAMPRDPSYHTMAKSNVARCFLMMLSLVEAVYRSMSGPYQYLVVGDPLSQPWSVSTKTAP